MSSNTLNYVPKIREVMTFALKIKNNLLDLQKK